MTRTDKEREPKEVLDNVEDKSVDASIEEDAKEGARLECDECGRTYGSKGSLRNHKYAHKKSRELGLDENLLNVDVALREEADIIKLEPSTEETKERFNCDDCGRTYGSKNSLRTHKYVHKNVKEEAAPENPLVASPE